MTLTFPRLLIATFGLAALAALTAPACSSESDVTAKCTPNATDNGLKDVNAPCDEFAICDKDRKNPAACCPGLSGSDLRDCLYGYGVIEAGGTGGSTGTSTTSTTTTTTNGTTPSGTGGSGGTPTP